MPYAQRDSQGNIVALFAHATEEAGEFLDVHHTDVQTFMGLTPSGLTSAEVMKQLSSSDTQLVRVLEDLLEVLIANKVILFTDLPTAAQVKLLERRSIRNKLHNAGDAFLSQDSDPILI